MVMYLSFPLREKGSGNLNLKRVLIFTIIFSLIVSLIVDFGRTRAENEYDTVEFVGDLKSLKDFASFTGEDLKSILTKMKEAGMDGVAVNEVTLESLQQAGKISVSLLKDVENLYLLSGNLGNLALEDYLKGLSTKDIEKYSNYIVVSTKNANTFKFLKEALTKRVSPKDLIILSKGNDFAFIINKPKEVFVTKGLGFDENELFYIKSLGFDLIPRVENFTGIKDRDITEYVSILKKYGVRTVIFNGTDVLGNPEKISYAASLFKENGINVGIIDVPMGKKLQEGMSKFAKFTGYRGIKVYGLSEKETQKYDWEEIVNKWFRGIIERNVRIIYVRAKIDDSKSHQYNIKENIAMIKDATDYIKRAGLKVGIAKPLPEVHQGKFIEVLISLGVVAAGLLILELFGVSIRVLAILGIIGVIGVSGILMSRFNDLGVKTVALAYSIVFPSLGIAYYVNRLDEFLKGKGENNFVWHALKIFFISLAISFAGALSIGAIMADSKYMLKIDYFRGVKFSFILPLIFYVFYYIWRVYETHNFKAFWSKIKEFLDLDLKVWHVMAFVIAAVAGILYISRTGNEPIIKPTELELKFRDFLEHTLIARPRTKEFLIGDPALLIGLYTALKKFNGWAFVAGLLGSIGILSITNTFSHVESVLIIAIKRTLFAWVLGALIGLIGIWLLSKILKNTKKEY